MKKRSNPIQTGATIGVVVWFLLMNGIAFIHDMANPQGAQKGWGTLGCYASVLLAPVGAGLGAFVGWLIARSRARAAWSRDSVREPSEELDAAPDPARSEGS